MGMAVFLPDYRPDEVYDPAVLSSGRAGLIEPRPSARSCRLEQTAALLASHTRVCLARGSERRAPI